MSDLDKLEKKYEKGNKAKDIRDLAKTLEGSEKAAFGIYPSAGKRAKRSGSDTAQNAISQAVAGFKSQWSGLDDEGKVGIGKGTPGIYYNTVAIPAIAGVVDEKYAPDFAVEADKKAGKIKEAVRKDMGINEPKGALEHFAYAGGEMLGQLPVPGALMNKIIGGAKKMGMAGKVAAAPIEYLSPTVDPRTINYGIGTTFGGTMGTVGEALSEEEPVKKALGGLIQKYEDGGKVGKVATFFSAVDKAINTLKQKKGTGEQILKQLETTPGIKPEELESRAIKQKLQASPKITQEELQKTIKANKPPIPKRIKLGQGVDPEWQPRLEKRFQNALEEFNVQPVVDPATGKNLGFFHPETGEILDANDVRRLDPEELGLQLSPTGKLDPEDAQLYNNLRRAVADAQEQFELALGATGTKFSQYSKSKGRNNYREILLQHEDRSAPGAAAISQRIDELLKSNPATEEEAAAVNKELNSLIDKVTTERQMFTASHWDDPDVLAHYRVSDMTGPNGEKVLYVDEIQSDWHQKARDARKREIKRLLESERSDIRAKALKEMGDTEVTNENEDKLKSVFNRLNKERKAELEKQVDENFGYRSAEDDEKLYQLNSRMERLRNTGMTQEELKEYFTPGKIVPGYGGMDKVLSFNSGEGSPAYKKAYDYAIQRAKSAGIEGEAAERWATKKATDETKYDWSVTVIEVDPKTGQPRKGADTRTHTTSPEKYIVDELRKEAMGIESKVPDAPFKKNWHELATKDILDLAAKEGYDKVAFSPGVEQVKRYESGIRQAVDSINYNPTEDGSLIIKGKKGDSTVFDGKLVGDTFVSGPGEGKTLAEVFGSGIAKQIEDKAPELHDLLKSPVKRTTDMPDNKDATDLLWEYGDRMTPDQKAWLRDFQERWELDVDGSPAGEGIASEMVDEYSKWLKQNKLRNLSPEEARLKELEAIPEGTRTPEQWQEFHAVRDKALNPESGTYPPLATFAQITGPDLTIGGEGMKSFYDQRLPSFVKNYAGKEFKAPTGYMEVENPSTKKKPSARDIERMMDQIADDMPDELYERSMDITHEMADRALRQQGLQPNSTEWEDAWWNVIDEFQERGHEQAARELATERLSAPTSEKIKAFSVDVTPQMKEKITTEGQKLFAATPAIGLGAAQLPQQMMPAEEPVKEEQPKDPPTAPQGFQEGGRVGKLKEASEKVLRVLHGGPSRIRLDREKNLDVTTDQGYAIKRAQDKMSQMGQEGPPMVNKFDVPAAKMLRFEETYSPEDVKLMRRFFNKLPEGKAMTGEEIYDATGGKDFVLEGIAKAGGFSGYERPAGGSGGVGNWFRVTDQEALTRKARGGLIQGYSDGGPKGGKVDLARRGLLGLRSIVSTPTQNLPAVVPQTPLASSSPPAKTLDVVSPLTQLVQKAAETPMSRRDVLKKAGNVAISQAAKGVVPMALKEAVLETMPIKASPVGNVENAVKNIYIDQMFENFYDDAAGHGETLFNAYESFLPFISQSLSKSEKKAIEKARDLFYQYGEDEIPDRVYDRISKGVDILQKKVAEKGSDIPIKDVLSPDMYKMSLEEMKDYGVEITPDMIKQLRKTEWAPDVFHDFDTP
jgi:uncharacterized protein YidB (DUF937 family)